MEISCEIKMVVYAKHCENFTDRLLVSMDHSKNFLDLKSAKVIFDPYITRENDDPSAPLIITGWVKGWADSACCREWSLSLYKSDDSILRIKTFVTDANTLAAACHTAVRYGNTIKLFSQSMEDDRFEQIIGTDDVDDEELEQRYELLEYELEQQRRESLVCIDLAEYRRGVIKVTNHTHNEK